MASCIQASLSRLYEATESNKVDPDPLMRVCAWETANGSKK